MDTETARKLIQFIASHMERESRFLYPNPQIVMYEPYQLLDMIRDAAKVAPETIDRWMLEAQKR